MVPNKNKFIIIICLFLLMLCGCRSKGQSLALAIYNHDIDKARDLIESDPELINRSLCGEDCDTSAPIVGKQPYTPLISALLNYDIDMARMLLDHGADPDLKDGSIIPASPLWVASLLHSVEFTKLLCAYGADVNKAGTNRERMPLMSAARYNNFKVVEFLIQQNADINARDYWTGETALFYAALVKDYMSGTSPEDGFESLILLLENGADPMIKNNHGETVIEYIKTMKDLEYDIDKAIEIIKSYQKEK